MDDEVSTLARQDRDEKYATAMKQGHEHLQNGELADALSKFQAADSILEKSDYIRRAPALQMVGVTSRLIGDLHRSSTALGYAKGFYKTAGNPLKAAACKRDLSAVHRTFAFLYLQKYGKTSDAFKNSKRNALRYIKGSQTTLEDLVRQAPCGSDEYYVAMAELAATKSLGAEIDLNLYEDETIRAHARDDVYSAYTTLKRINEDLRTRLAKEQSTLNPFEAYETNALIKALCARPLHKRAALISVTLHATNSKSQSAGSRKRALVALVLGGRIYRWFELRAAKRVVFRQ